MSRARRPAAATVLALGALAALGAGCGSGRGGPREDPLIASVRAGIAEQLGLAPAQVSCAGARCDVDVGGMRVGVAVAPEADDRDLDWQSDEVVLAAPLVAHIAAELDELGVTAAIDCGPPVQAVPADGRIACKVGDGGVAWVRLGDAGAVDVEIALTPEEVAARTAAADDAELERMSRALDRPDFDEDAGVPADDEGDEAADDAGSAPPAQLSRGPRG